MSTVRELYLSPAYCGENLKLLQFSFLSITSHDKRNFCLCNQTIFQLNHSKKKQYEVLLGSEFIGGADFNISSHHQPSLWAVMSQTSISQVQEHMQRLLFGETLRILYRYACAKMGRPAILVRMG